MSIRNFIRKVISGSPTTKLSPIKKEDISECLEVCASALSHVMSKSGVKGYTASAADWDISVKAEYGGKIVGCYVLNKQPIGNLDYCNIESLRRYKNLKGVQGVALAVLPEYRDLGIGKKLRQYPLKAGYDYIWGLHLKSLHNIDNWVKFGRRVVCDSGGMFTTLMDISPKAKEMTAKYNNLNKEKRQIKKKKITEGEFQEFHSFQMAGHTCGPTCIKMVADYLGVGYSHIDEIIELCGCNTKTGTIDTGIKNALDSLGVKNQQNLFHKDDSSAMDFLDSLLGDGDIFIMRTLTRGIKHWIIVYGKRGNEYLIADPWLGKITYGAPEILQIWSPREFDGFVVKR